MKPKSLHPNDQVAIVAPSGRVFPEELNAGLKLIRSWQLTAKTGENIFEDYFLGYHYAGTQQQRTADLQDVLDDDSVKAIWFARGGYGAVHLIDRINWTKFLQNPKWLIGYSDITAFHNHLNNFGIQTLHGVTVKRLKTEYTAETFESLRKVLFGEKLNYHLKANPYNRFGKAGGKLVGGNLSLICSLTGSRSEIKGENLILFIEDWFENWYHLDRMLMNLKRSGLLDSISGLIVGNFTKMDIEDENPDYENGFDPVSYEIIYNFIKDYNIPVCFGFPAGHTGDNRALIMGEKISLESDPGGVKIEF